MPAAPRVGYVGVLLELKFYMRPGWKRDTNLLTPSNPT